MNNLLAQAGVPGAIIGKVTNPLPSAYSSVASGGGIILLLTNMIRLMFVVAGIWALFNFLIAGYKFMNAGGDSKKIMEAWAKIWQSFMGLILIVSSFAVAGLLGYLVFGDASFILRPRIYGP